MGYQKSRRQQGCEGQGGALPVRTERSSLDWWIPRQGSQAAGPHSLPRPPPKQEAKKGGLGAWGSRQG